MCPPALPSLSTFYPWGWGKEMDPAGCASPRQRYIYKGLRAVAETLRALSPAQVPEDSARDFPFMTPNTPFPPTILERRGTDRLSVHSFDHYEHLIFLPMRRKWQGYEKASTSRQNAGSDMSAVSLLGTTSSGGLR